VEQLALAVLIAAPKRRRDRIAEQSEPRSDRCSNDGGIVVTPTTPSSRRTAANARAWSAARLGLEKSSVKRFVGPCALEGARHFRRDGKLDIQAPRSFDERHGAICRGRKEQQQTVA
jgi:hypothetical protein